MHTMTRGSFIQVVGASVALVCALPDAHAASIDVHAAVRASQFQAYVTADYVGDSAAFTPLGVVTPSDPLRFATAEVSNTSMSLRTEADSSGISRPDGFAHFFDFEVRFDDTPALQAALAASASGTLDFIARFEAAFTLVNTPNPKTGPVSGPFNQTLSQVDFDINVRGLAPVTVSGGVTGTNGPFEAYSITTRGVLTADKLNAGFFAFDVPFRIDATHLATTFDMETNGVSLSLDLPTSSSVNLRLPTANDVFLASGESAAALGLSVTSTAVPLPGSAWLLVCAAGTLVARRRQA